jgi:lysozyme
VIIKSPVCYDISHWKEVSDFNAISPRPYLMITKATESTWLRDSKFIRFFDGMKRAGYKRGCYHFHRKSADARAQALYFCNFIEPYIDDETILILDVEEGGETAEQLKVWFDVVRGIFPRNRLMLYSAKRILDPIVMTAAQREYFKGIPVWTAGYPFFPDELDTVPPVYIPDQSKFGAVVLWQYSEVGQVAGIEGDVDLNWISPTYQKLLGGASVPEEEEPMAIAEKWQVAWEPGCNKRIVPSTSNTAVGVLPMGTQFEVISYYVPIGVPETQERWGKLADGYWVALTYASQPRAVQVSTPPPAPVDEITVSVEADIVATINGKPYHGVVMFENIQLRPVE